MSACGHARTTPSPLEGRRPRPLHTVWQPAAAMSLLQVVKAAAQMSVSLDPTPALEGRVVARPAVRDVAMGVAIFVLFMFAEPIFGVLVLATGGGDGPNTLLRNIWIPVYAVLIPYFVLNGWMVLKAAWRTPALVLMGALAVASVAASVDPEMSSRRVFALTFTMLFGWWLAARFDWPKLIRILAITWALLTAGSYLFAVALPHLGVMPPDSPHPGAWRGLWTQKNLLGGYMAIGVLVFLTAAHGDAAARVTWRWFAVAAAGLVIMSTSATALLAMVAGFGIYTGVSLAQRGPVFAVGLTAVAGFAAIVGLGLLLVAPEVLFLALNRDPTLTGRTEIWDALLQLINSRPWLGFGYGAFWDVPDGPAFFIRRDLEWNVPNAHNGWLEVGLGVGWVAVALMGVSLAAMLLRSSLNLLTIGVGQLTLGFGLVFGFYSVSESYFLADNSIYWAVYVALAAKLAQPRQRADGL